MNSVSFKKNLLGVQEELLRFAYKLTADRVWGIERSGFFNGREKWAKGFENQRV